MGRDARVELGGAEGEGGRVGGELVVTNKQGSAALLMLCCAWPRMRWEVSRYRGVIVVKRLEVAGWQGGWREELHEVRLNSARLAIESLQCRTEQSPRAFVVFAREEMRRVPASCQSRDIAYGALRCLGWHFTIHSRSAFGSAQVQAVFARDRANRLALPLHCQRRGRSALLCLHFRDPSALRHSFLGFQQCEIPTPRAFNMSVTLHTNLGDIKVEVFCESVPKTAEVSNPQSSVAQI